MSQSVILRPDENGNNPIVQIQSNGTAALSVTSAAITTTATSADIPVGQFAELAVDVNISAVTGTSPSYTLSINRKGVDGVYYPIYTGTAQTVAGKVSVDLGVGASTNKAFGSTIQIVETISGTTPSFTRSISVQGK